jgi:hypothetical protein
VLYHLSHSTSPGPLNNLTNPYLSHSGSLALSWGTKIQILLATSDRQEGQQQMETIAREETLRQNQNNSSQLHSFDAGWKCQPIGKPRAFQHTCLPLWYAGQTALITCSPEAHNSLWPHEKFICCSIRKPKPLDTSSGHETHKCNDTNTTFLYPSQRDHW